MKNKIEYAEVFIDFKGKLFRKGEMRILVDKDSPDRGIYYNGCPKEKNKVTKVNGKWIYTPPTGLN